MLRDVFYYGNKPNVHPRERHAPNLEAARYLSTTEHFWIINEFCDYTGFDWDFDFDTLPDEDVWTEKHNNVWPSQHQKDSGTWLCNKTYTDIIYYREDVDPVKRKNIKTEHWEILHPIDESKFDFSWHPDPTEPPYIYRWGCRYFPPTHEPVVQYVMPGATTFKYFDTVVELVPRWDRWKILHDIEMNSFDFCWAPDPTSPPYIYTFGNQHHDAIKMPTLEYHMPNAEERKYVKAKAYTATLKQHPERFEHFEDSHGIDYSWVPDPDSGPYIYAWGNQWNQPEDKISIQYAVQGATTYKYMSERAIRRPCMDNWEVPEGVDVSKFDFSWEPSPAEPPFIYQFGTQWQKTGGPRYIVKGATEIKYVDVTKAKAKPVRTNWELPTDTLIDTESFDYSWHPDDTDPPYIYQFGTQWQKTGGPRYVVQGATEIKYIDSVKAKALSNVVNWEVDNGVPLDLNTFDFSWHPDNTEVPYIYQFGTQHQKSGGPRYVVKGATEIKYVESQKALALPNKEKFEVVTEYPISFDYSWHPDVTDSSYIYVFGNQHYPAEKMATVRYIMQGATEIKYINDHKATILPDRPRFKVYSQVTLIDETKFDFSWVPDPDDPPYLYVWGNKHVPGELYPTIEYLSKEINTVDGSTGRKFVHNDVELLVEWDRWNIIDQIDRNKFDFTWRPDPTAPPYIYAWGSKHVDPETSPAIEYKVPDATEYKFMNDPAEVLPRFENWFEYEKIDRTKFDYTWRPNPKEPPFIYAWGSKHTHSTISSVIEYRVPGATDYKHMDNNVETLPNIERWKILQPVDENAFDFTWHPSRNDPPYIYIWGNKWVPGELQSTIEYHVPGATDKKYMYGPAPVLPEMDRWTIVQEINKDKFDLTWRPDPREPPYIYVWGNKYIPGEKKPTLMYHMPNATEYKYLGDVDVLPELDRWEIHDRIDETKFDLCWRPDPSEPPYIYVWGNKYVPGEMRPTIEYHCEGATERKYMGDAPILPQEDRWRIHTSIDTEQFDLSWRPDPRDPPYIYVWGNKHVPAELRPTLEYIVPGATEYKYMDNVDILPEMNKYNVYHPVKDFDFTWMPDPREPPYIYVWGNKYVPGEMRPTVEYHCEGASQRKYMTELVELQPDWDRWEIIQEPSNFDFTWIPDPREPPYIYVWGNKYISGEEKPTIIYRVPGATEYKYIHNDVEVKPEWDKWEIHTPVDKTKFDFSWRPDPREPPFIYVWGNKYVPAELRPTLEYHCEGATQYKYMSEIVELVPQWDRWEIIQQPTDFDFTWIPDPREPPYIYVWGNKYIPGEKKPTVKYHVPGAIEYKYVHNDVKVEPEWDKWRILVPVDKSSFDFSWRPDPGEPPFVYVWGNQYNAAEVEPTIEYHADGAYDERKYMNDMIVKTLPMSENWKILIPIEDFDFSWRPNPGSPPYIYVFGNQWNEANVEPTVQYHVPGATEYNYVYDIKAKIAQNKENWEVRLSIKDFDFSWRPNPHDPPYIYVWGNKWNRGEIEPTVRYHVPDAVGLKYMTNDIELLPEKNKYKILIPIDESSFDFSWRPDPTSPPYIYVWGNQYNAAEVEPTIEYHCEGAYDERKYMHDQTAKTLPTFDNWETLIPIEDFDFSWRPHPNSPPYIYVFGNKWNEAATEPTIRYHVQGATDYKYIEHPVATPRAEMKYWSITNNSDLETFDFSWRPNPFSPPQIYQWEDNGPRYTVPGATEVVFMKRDATISKTKVEIARYFIKTTLEDLIKEHSDEVFWALNPDINYDNFNFGWKPNEKNFRHINVFGNEYAKDTQTYYINGPMYNLGHCEYNYVEDQKVEVANTKLSMFFIDRGNVDSNKRYDELKKRFPNIVKTRYLNSWVDTINRCLRKSETSLFWILNSEYDYTNFKFNFYPSPWQMKMVHVFGTQWSHWGHTYLINKETFIEDTKYVKIIEHLNCLNFVKGQRANATDCLYDIYLIDHGNFETSYIESELRNKYDKNKITVVPHNQNYLETFKTIIDSVEDKRENYIWICNSVCGYDDFDFSYICDPFSREQLHVFPSDRQKYGDTFLVNVDKLREQYETMRSLDDYDQINFNQHQRTNRLEAPEIVVEDDTHTEIIHKIDFEFPYVILKTRDNNDIRVKDEEPISLWSNRSKTVTVTTTGATRIIVPKEVKKYVKDEYYDYPFISENIKKASKPLDIVFLSNGESNAEENYQHLLEVTKGLPNRVVRVDGVNGRVAAYHAAAAASNTNWLFTVFAKLKVDKDFDWGWQPDRLRKPKHYIFYALNPVNGLSYGHQAMIAYNKKLTLANSGRGLDFTLDDLHDTVPTLSGVAEFNTDSYSTWRTAFREVIKLKSDYEAISAERLKVWLSVAEGNFAEDCLRGARDAINYYNEVNGDIDQLKLSYEWDWLKNYYGNKYK